MPNLHAPLPERARLNGVISRAATHALIEHALATSPASQDPFALILFDIDRFKLVNLGFGDSQGDAVLQAVANIGRNCLRSGDTLGHWGGQQFMCVLPHTHAEQAYAMAEKIRKAIDTQPVHVSANVIYVSASFGVAGYPEDGNNTRKLLSATDAALYAAKESGRNRSMLAGKLEHQPYDMGNMLESALREDRMHVAYQPIIDLNTKAVVGEEALARIINDDGHILEAADFIDSARLLQLTHKIDRTVLLQTMQRCVRQLSAGGPAMSHFMNISGNLLRHPLVVQELLDTAMKSCMSCADLIGPVKPLVIEVTERELLGDIPTARALLKPFTDFGLRLALDDFGSGYSSFHYLSEFPFSFLKIEGSLVKRLEDPKVRTIVQGMQRIAQELDLITIVEFVENETIATIARDIGINWAQGYYFSEPLMN
jgi:diguanylate cyclase (GGDEF)-like protein